MEASAFCPAFLLEHDTAYLGHVLDIQVARDIAWGKIDPATKV